MWSRLWPGQWERWLYRQLLVLGDALAVGVLVGGLLVKCTPSKSALVEMNMTNYRYPNHFFCSYLYSKYNYYESY